MFSFQKSIYYFRPAILCLLILGGLVVVPFSLSGVLENS